MHALLHLIAANNGGSTTGGNGLVTLIPLLLIGVFFYFIAIRPRSRQVRAERELLQSLEVGDEVLTRGGLFGRIVELDDEAAVLEVAPGTRLRFIRSAIARRLTEDEPEEEEEDQEAGESP
jgi:preprotein translocase subunit YajC